MKLSIIAVGRAGKGPEAELVDDYLSRLTKAGRTLGLTAGPVREVEDRKGKGREGEATLLRAAIPEGSYKIALDERGRVLTSPDFAKHIALIRDRGVRDCVFLIGGADGLAPELRDEADLVLSFGRMVWPHMLARAMLAEQLYRAATILAGGPYHRV